MNITNKFKPMQSLKKLLLLAGGLVVVALVVSMYLQKPGKPEIAPSPTIHRTPSNVSIVKGANFTVNLIGRGTGTLSSGGYILVIKNTGNVNLTNITFAIHVIHGKRPTLLFGVVKNIKKDKIEEIIDKIPELGVNKSIYLIETGNDLYCSKNASEMLKYSNVGWLVIKCDQGVEKRILCIWNVKPTMKYNRDNSSFHYLEILLLHLLFSVLVVTGIIYIIIKIRRKKR